MTIYLIKLNISSDEIESNTSIKIKVIIIRKCT